MYRLFLSIALLCLISHSVANPTGEQVVAGQAGFDRSGGQLTVNQMTDRAIVQWQDFSIGQGELTRFVQPSSQSAALNRVVSGNPSAIYGSLQANGQVFLINPNGIVVGPTGIINAQSFIAATLDVPNEQFMTGGDLSFSGGSAAWVTNDGYIEALGGDVFLIGAGVQNNGRIDAAGDAGMAGGSSVLLKAAGDERLAVRLGNQDGAVINRGAIEAARVELKAAGNNPYALAIQHQGLIRATGAVHENGRVILSASGGRTEVSGDIVAEPGAAGSGLVRIYSADDTVFTGHVDALSQGEVHISGAGHLVFEGTVDTEGGLLVLDPNNVEITSVAATLAGASTIAPAAITGALGGSNVVIHTSGTDGEPGILRVTELLFYGSANNLSLLAHGDVEVNASVRNSFTGNVNIVAGWDGVTGFAATDNVQQENGDLNVAAIFGNAASYGNLGGDVFIGNGTQTGAVAVGSRDGDTNVAGFNLNMQGSNAAANSPAHLGFRTDPTVANEDSTGAVTVMMNGAITAVGGSQMAGYVQIGHAGADGPAPAEPDGDQSGDINVSALGNISFTGGTGNVAYAQIGHGGINSDGNFTGAINVTSGGNISFVGNAFAASAQLGHGGLGADGNHSGVITVNGVNFTFTGGSTSAYAQLGHGGFDASGNHSGDINATATGDLDLAGGTGAAAFAMIGHGDAAVTNVNQAIGTRQGDLALNVTGEISLVNGAMADAPWFIGHASLTPAAVSNADVTLTAGTLDYSAVAAAVNVTLNQDFADKFEQNLAGGNVDINVLPANGLLVNNGIWNYNSANLLSFDSVTSTTIDQPITNAGVGNIDFLFSGMGPATFTQNAAIASGGAVNVTGTAGDDTFTLLPGLDANFAGTYVFDGGGGTESLSFDDSADVDGEIYTLGTTTLAKNASNLTFLNFEALSVSTGGGDDGVLLNGAPTLALTVDGGAGTETLTYDDSGDATGANYVVDAASVTKGASVVNFANFEALSLSTGGGDDGVLLNGAPARR